MMETKTHFAATDGTTQSVGGIGVDIGKFNLRYENDGAPMYSWFGGGINDGQDRFRTAAAQIGYGDFNLRMLLFTGRASSHTSVDEYGSSKYPLGYYLGGDVDKYRLGAVSLGYKGYRVGVNTEAARHVFQNQLAHTIISPQPSFKVLNNHWYPYYYWGANSRYSLWY